MAEKIRVLYVDDEPGLLNIGKRFLEREGGFTVDTLTSAIEALAHLNSEGYDAIVSDYQMPEMDGITFLKQLKASGNTAPFIIFTGKGREEVVIEALNEGADFYLQKGGEPKAQYAELANKIRYAVTRKQVEEELSESQKRTADIIEFLPDATFAISNEGVVIAWNRAMEAMTGVVKSEVLNKGNYEYSLPFYRERRPLLVDLVLNPLETTAEKYPFIRKDGDKFISEILIPHFHDGKGAYLWFTASPLYDSQGNLSGAIESIRDITEQKHAEGELRSKNEELNASYEQIAASEETLRANLSELTRQEQTLQERETQLRATLESTADGILAVDNNGKILLASRRFAEIWRIPPPLMEQGDDSALLDFVLDQVTDSDVFLNKVQSLYGSDAVDKDILTFKDSRAIERYSFPMMMDGALIGRVWSFRDITERKRAEEALRENENQLDAMATNIPGVVYRFYVNPDGTTGFNYISERSRQVLGIENDPATFFDRVADGIVPEDRGRFISSVQHAISTKSLWEFDGGYVRPSGKKIWMSAVSSPVIEDDRLIFDGVIFDNTGRKRAEEALRESEQRHRSIVEALPGFLFHFSADGHFIDCQVDKHELLLLQPGEVIGKQIAEILPPDLAELTKRKLKETLRSGQLQIYEYSLIVHEQKCIFEARMIPGGADTVWAFVHDITGRKRADASLVQSEEQSRMLLSQLPDIVMVHQDGIMVYANQTAVDKTGFSREELIGSRVFDHVAPGYREIIARNMTRRAAGEQVGDYEVDMVHKSGAMRHVIVRTSPIVFNQVPSVVMILIDITERNQAELALKESENLYRTIFETTGAATIIIDNDTKITMANAGFATLSGFSIDELEGKKSWTEFVVPEDLEQMKQYHQDRRNDPAGEARVYEFRFINRNGEIRHCINNVSVIPGTAGSVASVVDITDRKLSEEALRDSEKKYRDIFENSVMGLYKTAPGGQLINANDTFARMYGYSSADEILKSGLNAVQLYANPEDRNEVVDHLAETGVVENYETRNLKRDGTVFWASIIARAIRDTDGTVLFYEGSCIDITGRKRADELLRESEEKYRLIFEDSPLGHLSFDENGVITACNNKFIQIIGSSREALIGLDMLSLPDKKIVSAVQTALAGNNGLYEGVYTSVTGKKVTPVRGLFAPVNVGGGRIHGGVGIFEDITERKMAEDELQRHSETLSILNSIISTANQAEDLPRLLDSILSESLRMLDFDAGGIYLVDRSTRTATIVQSVNLPPEFLAETQTIPIDNEPYDTLFIQNEPIITENYETIAPGHAEEFGFGSIASIPLLSKGAAIGALNIASQRRHTISEVEKQVLLSIGRELGSTIERMASEEEVKKANKNIETLFDSIDEMVFVMDMQGNIIRVNGTVSKRLSYAPGELTGTNVLLLHVPERRDEALRIVQGMIAGTIDSCPVPVVAKDGTRIEVETKVTRGSWNNQEVLIGVTRDVTERRQAEEALRLSEKKYRSIFDNFPDLYYQTDLNGIITRLSPSVTGLSGWLPEELIGHPTTELYPFPQERTRLVETLLRTGEIKNYEITLLQKDGQYLMASVNGHLLYDEAGTPSAIEGTIRDITERRQAGEKIQQQLQFLEQLIDTIPNPIFFKQVNGVYQGCNLAFCEYTGLDKKDIIGKTARQIYPADLADIYEKNDQRVFDSPDVRMYETLFLNAKKEARNVIIYKNTFTHLDGSVAGLLGVIVDITERKAAEDALRESENLFALFMDYIPVIVFVKDNESRTLFVNKYMDNAVGASKWIGKTVLDFIPGEFGKKMVADDMLAMTLGYQKIEECIHHLDGKLHYYETQKFIIPRSGKEPLLGGISLDITERNYAEEALRQANRKLTLLSGITRHDINNQLTVLMGFLSLLEKKQPDPTFNEYFLKVANAAERISAMIRFTEEYECIGVHAPTWQDCRTLVDTAAKEGPLGKVMVKDDLPAGAEVFADPLIVKVFYNLMDNAVRYGGNITTIQFSALESGDSHVIVCEDDGIGIPPKEKEKIFNPGFGKNTGLGLAISREILSITGITIRETGEPGKGARFEMVVPDGMWRRNEMVRDGQVNNL